MLLFRTLWVANVVARSTTTCTSPAAVANRVRGERGCNKAQQCGAPTKGHILHPRELAQFRGHELAALAAGHRHSAAVLDNGQVHSWGRNSSGQLGLGIGGDDAQPQGVTAFDGSPRVRSAALGYQHSLFVDISGSLWGAGDNSRGQLGLGTLIQGAWAETPQPMQPMPVFLVKSELKQRLSAMGLDGGGTGDTVSQHLVAPVPLMRKQAHVRAADAASLSALHSALYTADDQMNEGTANRVAAAAIGFGDPEDLLRLQGVHFGQFPTPMRAGHALHPLLAMSANANETRALPSGELALGNASRRSLSAAGGPRDTAGSPEAFHEWLQELSQQDDGTPRAVSAAPLSLEASMLAYSEGLHHEHVVKVAASKLFSAAVTGSGEVWTFGVGAHRELGTENVLQTEGCRVTGALAALIANHGGAVDIAVGASFCIALTRNGTVIVWGHPAPEGMVVTGGKSASGGKGKRGRGKRLPAMVSIVAGEYHALLSDGESVWVCQHSPHDADRIWSDAMKVDLPKARIPDSIVQGLHGVAKLSAGGEASALIDQEAKLWMWGRLAVARAKDDPPVQLTSGKAVMPCLNDWERAPVQVECLGGVTDVALGTNHVLAAASEYHSS